jgi:hypothetical protein
MVDLWSKSIKGFFRYEWHSNQRCQKLNFKKGVMWKILGKTNEKNSANRTTMRSQSSPVSFYTCKWKQKWWWGLRRPTRVRWSRLHKLASLDDRNKNKIIFKKANSIIISHSKSTAFILSRGINGHFLFWKQSATSIYRDKNNILRNWSPPATIIGPSRLSIHKKFKLKYGILSFWIQNGILFREKTLSKVYRDFTF